MNAKQTNVPDPDGASRGLASLYVQADDMHTRVQAILKDITAQEGNKPWGTAEYGKKFEENYFSSGGGAHQVKENAGKLAEHTRDGAKTAFQALTGTVDLDDNQKNLFKTGPEINQKS